MLEQVYVVKGPLTINFLIDAGIGNGANESVTPDRYSFRMGDEVDVPFIEAIESYRISY